MLYHCNDTDFNEKVLSRNETIIVDFYAEWCAPCRMLAPIMEELGEDYEVCKVNVDEAPFTARRYNIQSIPTIIVFKNGSLENHIVGLADKSEILKMLD